MISLLILWSMVTSQSCQIKNCMVCDADGGSECNRCSPGFKLESNLCLPKIQNCEIFEETGSLCTSCSSGYTPNTEKTACLYNSKPQKSTQKKYSFLFLVAFLVFFIPSFCLIVYFLVTGGFKEDIVALYQKLKPKESSVKEFKSPEREVNRKTTKPYAKSKTKEEYENEKNEENSNKIAKLDFQSSSSEEQEPSELKESQSENNLDNDKSLRNDKRDSQKSDFLEVSPRTGKRRRSSNIQEHLALELQKLYNEEFSNEDGEQNSINKNEEIKRRKGKSKTQKL